MTVRDYISDKLKAYGVSEAQFADMQVSTGIDPESDVTQHEPKAVAVAIVSTLEELILAPRLSNVNESGFSMSWDFSNVARYYLWLCRKWGIKPSDDVLPLMGVSVIKDKTNIW